MGSDVVGSECCDLPPFCLLASLMVQHPLPLAVQLSFFIMPVAYFPCNLTRLNVGLSAGLGLIPMFEVCFDPSGWGVLLAMLPVSPGK